VRVERDSRTARAARSLFALARARAARGRKGAAPAVAPSPSQGWLASRAYRTVTRAVKTLDYVRYVRAALRQVRRGRAAIFVAHDLITLQVGWWAKLYSEHDAGDLGGRLARLRWRAVEDRLIHGADRVITVNESIADELVRRYRIARPTVIRNVPRVPRAAAAGIDLRERLAIADGVPIVLYLGGLTRNRGLEQLIASIPWLPDCAIAMVGPAAAGYRPTLDALIARAGAGDRVHVLDPVPPDAVIATARSADVGVSFIQNAGLNNYYSLPNKLFEYVHAGLPVVTSTFPELERVVAGRGIGVTCDPADPEAIAAALGSLLRDPERRARMSANALAAACELSWEAEGQRYVALFDELAVRAGGR
jgi:glycosyltransferase involved in cell wall biosynthesis